MEIIIEKNDAFEMLQVITNGAFENLESFIIRKMKDERLMSGDPEDCGKSLDDIRTANGYSVDEFINVLFRNIDNKDEIPELLNVIVLMGSGSDRPCPECGCELVDETDGGFGHEWTDTKCSNTECGFADTTEPDWNIQNSKL